MRRALVTEIIAPEGLLDSYLLRLGADPSTAKVYLINASAAGGEQGGDWLPSHADVDLLVYAKRPDGSPWRVAPRSSAPLDESGTRVNVVSGYFADDVDDIGYYEWTLDIPDGAVLLRTGSNAGSGPGKP